MLSSHVQCMRISLRLAGLTTFYVAVFKSNSNEDSLESRSLFIILIHVETDHEIGKYGTAGSQ